MGGFLGEEDVNFWRGVRGTSRPLAEWPEPSESEVEDAVRRWVDSTEPGEIVVNELNS